MAPGRMYFDDDFILTISDNESVPDLDNGTEEPPATKKRKEAPLKTQKDSKRRKKEEPIVGLRQDEQDIHEEDEEEDSGAINSDFEFDIGDQSGITNGLIGGWDLPQNGETTGGRAAGVDLDDIISSRRARGVGLSAADEAQESSASDEDGSADFDGVDDQDREVSDDDEDEDEEGFGAGAPQDSDDHDEDAEDSDSDSVAEPVPHPDDALSDVGSDREDVLDVAQTARQTAFFAPEEPLDSSKAPKDGSFQAMSLSRPILKGLNAVGFTSPTPIQVKAVPVALLGKDLVGGAVTGSGKTAAFIIPILERLLYRPKKIPTTRVAILMPTRELAVQCFNVATKLATFTDVTFSLLVGGLSLREQEQALKKRPDIVIATPGRFIDHMRNSASFAIESIEILVLDEADRMLEDGFADELNEILSTIPKSRQTMLFSATMTQDVDKLIRAGLQRPVRLMVDAKRQTVQGLVQEFIKLKSDGGEEEAEERRLAYLLHLCSEIYTTKTIIFLPRKALAHRVKVLFALRGIKAAELHGSMSQEQRLAAISSFRDGQRTHLLATDLASRGLDIPHTDTVINYSVPNSSDTYLHRVGRTARAGRSGVACTLFLSTKTRPSKEKSSKTASERTLLRPILRIARSQKAIIRTRSIPIDTVDRLLKKISTLEPEIEAVLLEEKEQKLLQQSERDLNKGQNLVKYEDEIASRPKRTWFQTEKEKRAASELGRVEHNGVNGTTKPPKREKRKLTGNDRRKLLNKDDRRDGKAAWKKGKEERAGRGVLSKDKKSNKKKK